MHAYGINVFIYFVSSLNFWMVEYIYVNMHYMALLAESGFSQYFFLIPASFLATVTFVLLNGVLRHYFTQRRFGTINIVIRAIK